MPLYARTGVLEVWLVNRQTDAIEMFRACEVARLTVALARGTVARSSRFSRSHAPCRRHPREHAGLSTSGAWPGSP
ncbi:MAG TPA: hypothetical protein VLF19_07415 [Methylomirabilota bacterium]|nr:hypothetical protein [Methylomirabilota bacterium]